MHSGLNTINFNAHYRLHHILRITLHAATLWWLFYAGFSWTGLAVFLAHYIVGVLSITVSYHRYFSHKTFKTSRIAQLIMAAFGCAQMQGDRSFGVRSIATTTAHQTRPMIFTPRSVGFTNLITAG